ncbi:NAD-dependent epimerase/dehydratase family protein [Accumulibacter sp.]|uniref:UDP-2-acetamido-2,6-beta-L-arabino-hexul-4-ose reductase n=1 Tax=Accumulibacter sp. TaxID=2053492 RepID=UPI0026373764|nr:NAD-dependent epimerase/dehydratase family protein [Accumulibacter sp.]
MRIVITGADGFIGRNLVVRLKELGHTDLVGITLESTAAEWQGALKAANFVFHLAGVNRPKDASEFATGNAELTDEVCRLLADAGNAAPVVLSSSTQAELDNPYGRSKRAAEDAVFRHGEKTGAPTYVFRLTNVFGKWSQPNYNSAVATFCHNVARGLPITINDPTAPLRLVYIDDVMGAFVRLLDTSQPSGFVGAEPEYLTTVGDVAKAIVGFADSRKSMLTERVGTGLMRALYSTYLSFLSPESFSYEVPCHTDPRGVFVEMLKTPDCGQFSYFTAHPGVTRGEHYHHTKTEKFLVIRGTAQFAFRHIVTGERYELLARGGEGRIVETVPGWTHNITNVGDEEMIVMLWANEIFDREHPDTVAMKVRP